MSKTFWYACVPIRVTIAVVLCFVSRDVLNIVAGLAIVGALGFMWRMATYDAQQTQLGRLVDWNHLRPVHIILWIAFAALVFAKSDYALIVPFIDVLVGIVFHGLFAQ
jgi:hypothetical protein